MAPEIIASIIGAAGSAVAGGIGAGSTAIANRQSYKYSKKFFDYQNQYNLSTYSPAQNMERLRQAGINPHEVAGTPGSGMSMQGHVEVPDYQSPLGPAADAITQGLQFAMQAYQMKKNLDNQSELVQSQINKNNADAAKTTYQTSHILPFESEYAKNRQKIPLYQLGTMKLQQQNLLNEISLFGMQKQKYQLALDLLELEKQLKSAESKYAPLYYRSRANSVYYDSKIKSSESGIRDLDLSNYQKYGIRPQDPYYTRIVTNTLDDLGASGGIGDAIRSWLKSHTIRTRGRRY